MVNHKSPRYCGINFWDVKSLWKVPHDKNGNRNKQYRKSNMNPKIPRSNKKVLINLRLIGRTFSSNYLGSRLLSVVCPNCFSSPLRSPCMLIGNAMAKLTTIVIDIMTIMCRWKERYCTASSPHFERIWSSLKITPVWSHWLLTILLPITLF